ncbi:MAG TPA: prolyl oligopeptidase family serine peptidase [Pyrinomonadaceae bacterium]|nr:prolyl oligopeptidase family serine peptidase [Pyrinomonadaceae bacterium]
MKTIKVSTGQEVSYNSWLATRNAETRPILISFHGWGGSVEYRPDGDQFKNWNIFAPWDRSGVARNGCWWLGQNRQFFMVEAIDELVRAIREEFSLKGDIYAWGSSMGGFGALFHSFRCKFKAVAVNVPQVRLIGSDYMTICARDSLNAIWDPEAAELTMEEAARRAQSGEDPDLAFSDATSFLDLEDATNNPVVFISQSRKDTTPYYFTEQTLYLVHRLVAAGCNFELYVEPRQGHYFVRDCHNVLALFEKFHDVIENPIDCGRPQIRS